MKSSSITILGPCSLRELVGLIGDIDINEVPDLGHGGIQVVLQAAELVRRGWQVQVITLEKGIDEAQIFKCGRLIFIAVPQRSTLMSIMTFYVKEVTLVKAYIKDFDPNIVHSHWTYEYAVIGQKSGYVHVNTVRDWPVDVLVHWNDRIYRFLRMLVFIGVCLRQKRFISNSLYIQDRLARYGINSVVVPNAVGNRVEARSRPDKDPEVILSIGNDNPQKNIKTLIKAFSLIVNEMGCKNIKLMLVGKGLTSDGYLADYASLVGVDHAVIFKGELSHDMAMLALERCDIYCHPSVNESFGNTLIEAMQCGKPIVAGKDSGAVSWVLNYGEVGLLCDIRNPVEISSALLSIITDDNLRVVQSEAGKKRVQSFFSIESIVDKLENVYQQMERDE